jgi:peptidoglycan/LPS O-acetylase OafA/YrhL
MPMVQLLGILERLEEITEVVLTSQAIQKYRPDIDGIRAVAILSVVLYHASVPMFTGGFTGVDIFFVISGYLIGGHIVSEVDLKTFTFSSFYRRRAKRILPAFYLMMAFAILVAIALLSPYELYRFSRTAFATILSASNIFMAKTGNYFRPNKDTDPLLMTWSLGVEEQFYLVIPALLFLLMRFWRRVLFPAVLVVCVISFLFSWYLLKKDPNATFYLLPSRAWELGAGVLLAIVEVNPKYKITSARVASILSLAGLALMVAPIFLLKPSTPFPGPAALPSVLGTVLFIAGAASWINRKLLSVAPMIFIGKVSYSWYLWHWPLLAFLRIGAGRQLTLAESSLAVLFAFVAAVVSYYLVEQPFRMSSLAPLPLLSRYAAVSFGFLAVAGALWISHGLPGRYPALADEGKPNDPCLVDLGVSNPYLSSPCYAASDPRPAVALWGDSHSEALAPKFREIANSQGYNFVQLGKTSCLPLKGVANVDPENITLAPECIQFNQRTFDAIAADHRIQFVVLAGRWGYQFRPGYLNQLISTASPNQKLVPQDDGQQLFAESLSAQIRSLQQIGKRVIVVGDVPSFDFNPALRYRMVHMPIRRTVASLLRVKVDDSGLSRPTMVKADKTAEQLLESAKNGNPGSELVDLQASLCTAHADCLYVAQGRALYWDEQHLTPAGAEYALRAFRFPGL